MTKRLPILCNLLRWREELYLGMIWKGVPTITAA